MLGRLVVGAIVAAFVGAACSGGGSVGEAVPDTTPTAVPTPSPTPTVTPEPTPTPVPRVADVLSPTAPPRGSFELSIAVHETAADAGEAFPLEGRYDSAADAVEVTFVLEAFLAFAALADPAVITDPLVGAAPEVLGGNWVVRRVGSEVFVQQPFLVEAAGGEGGDWLRVEDPAVIALLASGGLLSGSLHQQGMHDLLRSGGEELVWSDADRSVFEFDVDGSKASVGGRDAAATASFVGITNLDQAVLPAVVTVDGEGLVTRAVLDVPQGGFGPSSPSATLDIAYGGGQIGGLSVPERIAPGGPAA